MVPGLRGKYGFCWGLSNWPGSTVAAAADGASAGPPADAHTAEIPPRAATVAATAASLLAFIVFSFVGVGPTMRWPS